MGPNPICPNCAVPDGPENCDADAEAPIPPGPGRTGTPLAAKLPNTSPTASETHK